MHPVSPPPSAEWSLLRAACSEQRAETKEALLRLLASPIQWKILLDLADKHGCVPLLAQTLSKSGEHVPADVLKSLSQRYQINLHKSLFLSRELIRILEKLSGAGIEAIPYKGLALAETVYGDIALRQSGDIDLLVRARDFVRVREAARELGYTPHFAFSKVEQEAYLKSGYECAFDGTAGRNLLEVQWALQPRFYSVNVEIDALFDRASTATVVGYAMKTLSAEDLFLALALHAAKHLWGRLIWICDLARVSQLPSLDWKKIALQAQELGVNRIVWVSLILAERILQSPIPPEANRCLPRDSSAGGIAEQVEDYLATDVTFDVESLAYFRWMVRLRERRADQTKFMRRLVFTPGPGEWAVVRLPKALFPLYRVIRMTRLAARLVQQRL